MSEGTVSNPMEEDNHASVSDSEWFPEEEDEEEDNDDEEEEETEMLISIKNLTNFKECISMGMRSKMSDRQISNMNNTRMVDMGIGDKRAYLTPSKVRRLKIKYGLELAERHQENSSNLEAIAFDGKASVVAKEHCKTVKEDKTSVINGVNYNFVEHFIATPGTGFNIGLHLFKVQLIMHIYYY